MKRKVDVAVCPDGFERAGTMENAAHQDRSWGIHGTVLRVMVMAPLFLSPYWKV